MAAWKIAPALCAGCTVVLKPAEATPMTALALARILDGIPDLPKGAVSVVTGDGPVVGALLAESDLVDKVAFTGSTRTGRAILRAAADSNLKRVTLELGGKSPNIFFADADWEAAVEGAVFGVFVNQGEVCSAGSRILVEKAIHAKFLDAVVAKAKTIRLGDPLDRDTRMGPLVTAAHRDRVIGYVEQESTKARSSCSVGASRAARSRAVCLSSPRFSTAWIRACGSRRRRSSVRWFP